MRRTVGPESVSDATSNFFATRQSADLQWIPRLSINEKGAVSQPFPRDNLNADRGHDG